MFLSPSLVVFELLMKNNTNTIKLKRLLTSLSHGDGQPVGFIADIWEEVTDDFSFLLLRLIWETFRKDFY